ADPGRPGPRGRRSACPPRVGAGLRPSPPRRAAGPPRRARGIAPGDDRAMGDVFKRYLLPGFVFEAAVIGGGYATGRELVGLFLPPGPLVALLGMAVSLLVGSAVLAVSFELARRARAYDYRS